MQLNTRVYGRILILGIITLIAYSCQHRSVSNYLDNADNQYNKASTLIKNNNTDSLIEDHDCDTIKFKDFKNNLTVINGIRSESEFYPFYKIAKSYIDKECKKDTMYCGEIKRAVAKAYQYDSKFKLFLVGYTYENAVGMEDNSVSLFVIAVFMNDQLLFSDVLSDLAGEIQTELNGLEVKDDNVIVWGHSYPYFGSDFGIFKLTICQGNGIYEYQCHGHQI